VIFGPIGLLTPYSLWVAVPARPWLQLRQKNIKWVSSCTHRPALLPSGPTNETKHPKCTPTKTNVQSASMVEWTALMFEGTNTNRGAYDLPEGRQTTGCLPEATDGVSCASPLPVVGDEYHFHSQVPPAAVHIVQPRPIRPIPNTFLRDIGSRLQYSTCIIHWKTGNDSTSQPPPHSQSPPPCPPPPPPSPICAIDAVEHPHPQPSVIEIQVNDFARSNRDVPVREVHAVPGPWHRRCARAIKLLNSARSWAFGKGTDYRSRQIVIHISCEQFHVVI